MDTVKTAELEQVMRLAAKAKAEGVRLYVDRRDNRHYASSGTTEGRLYFVTLASCTCPGFAAHGHCKHWAALQLAIALPGPPEPNPSVCSACAGNGVIEQPRSRWIGGSRTGFRDEWSVAAPCRGCQPVAA